MNCGLVSLLQPLRLHRLMKRSVCIAATVIAAVHCAFAQTDRLPVIYLTADGLSTQFTDGTFRLDSGTVMQADIRWRGATSLRYQKKSYAIKLKDASGNKLDASLLGMRSDNSWILDAMAVDKARMRNRVSTDLWLDFSRKPYYFAQEPELVNGTHGKFVEVYLNGRYDGLYCLTEKVDRKQLKLKKYKNDTVRGILYKATTHCYMWEENESKYAYDNTKPTWAGWEVQYPDVEDGEPIDWAPLVNTTHWLTFAPYEAIDDSLQDVVDMPLWADYFLLVDLMLGNDNAAKNVLASYYDLTKPGQKLVVTPWDMDATWGRSWKADTLSAYRETGLYHNIHGKFLYARSDSALIYGPRYSQLRQTYFSADSLKKYFKTYFDLFRTTGAAERETQRWSGVDGIELDFDAEEAYIYEWIDQRLAFLDEYYRPRPPEIADHRADSLLLPVLHIATVNEEEPTCDYVTHPEGSMGEGIANATKVPARLRMTLQGNTLYDSGDYDAASGGLTIKIRGNVSAYGPKKPYKLKLRQAADLLCRDDAQRYADSEWLLLDLSPKTLLGLKVSELIGLPYTPAQRIVNVEINGKYRGVYLLSESVKRNPQCRINVDAETGFVTEIDPYWWNESFSFTTDLINDRKYRYTFTYPDADDVDAAFVQYVQSQLNLMEQSIQDGTYPARIDVPSWAKWLLGQDLLGISDSGGSNRYLAKYNDVDTSKIFVPCMWDFDTMGGVTDDWARTHYTHTYLVPMMKSENPAFMDAYWTQWSQLSPVLMKALVSYYSEQFTTPQWKAAEASVLLDEERWHYTSSSLKSNLSQLLTWLSSRKQWLDTQYETASLPAVPADDMDAEGNIYTLSGLRIAHGNIHTLGLPRGIYLVGRKKYIVR
ncbi:MAG: CotH kinase family protein [Bacteroidaceae bacterium]|nr:CotH kinase family protein [Bacteroidaceae bacterium]